MLQIHLFGQLRILTDGAPHAFRSLPKTLSLFAYLLAFGLRRATGGGWALGAILNSIGELTRLLGRYA
jgi:hypothetical protein